jgi:menaquinone-dependent protoporphyrinogen oxidase
MKILVAVASKHGSTREIAEAITEELRNSSLDVDLHDVNEVRDISHYNAIILGSAIYVGSWLPEAKRFAEQYQEGLLKVPVWLFSSGPLGVENPRPPDDPDKLASAVGEVRARDHKVFVGQLDPAKLGLGERLLAKVVGAPAGDFRDWDAIRVWARGLATELRLLSAATINS